MALISLLLLIILIYISIKDISTLTIPSRIIWVGYSLGLITTIYTTYFIEKANTLEEFQDHLLASIFAYLSMYSMKVISEKMVNKRCLGLGDAKLSALGGAWLGSKGIIISLTLAFLFAGVISIYGRLSKRLGRFQAFPFAPFISSSIFGVWLLGEDWWIQNWMNL
tara:strand:- start:2206 stop:2703 length:498 start_codon:yes stop_codon:yes gene_type:complete